MADEVGDAFAVGERVVLVEYRGGLQEAELRRSNHRCAVGQDGDQFGSSELPVHAQLVEHPVRFGWCVDLVGGLRWTLFEHIFELWQMQEVRRNVGRGWRVGGKAG